MAKKDQLHALWSKEAICEQIYTYCRAIDRMDRELVNSVWHQDGTIDFSDGMVTADYPPGPPPVPFTAHFDFVWPFRSAFLTHSHQATNIIIELDGDIAGSETTSITVLQKAVGDEIEQMVIWGRWLDRWSLRDGRWAIDHRMGVMDCAEVSRFRPEPIHRMEDHLSKRDRSDPSYGFLNLSTDIERLRRGGGLAPV